MRLSHDLVFAGRQICVVQSLGPTTPWRFPAHTHEGWSELQYVASGTLHQQVNGQEEDLSAGDLLLVRRDDEHVLHGQGFMFFNVLIPDAEWQRLATYLGDPSPVHALLTAPRPPRVHLSGAAREHLEAELARLFTHQQQPEVRMLLGRFLLDLLPRLAGVSTALPATLAVTTAAPAWLRRLCADLDDLLDQGIDQAGLARRAGVSPEHLARTIRRHLGLTPTALLNRRRLERAALLLTHTDRSVLDIALELGFGSASVFSRSFRQLHQDSPRAWRSRHGVGWRSN